MPLQTTEARAKLRAVVAKLMKEARSTGNGKEPVTHLCTADIPGRSCFPCHPFLAGPVLRIHAPRLPVKAPEQCRGCSVRNMQLLYYFGALSCT